METYTRFLYEFLSQFFAGIIKIFSGFGTGIAQIFDIPAYKEIIEHYKNDFSISEWVLVALAIITIALVIGMFIALLIFVIKKYFGFRKKVIDQDALLEEVATLNKRVTTLMKEKDEILAMKVSQLGLKPGESSTEEVTEQKEEDTSN